MPAKSEAPMKMNFLRTHSRTCSRSANLCERRLALTLIDFVLGATRPCVVTSNTVVSYRIAMSGKARQCEPGRDRKCFLPAGNTFESFAIEFANHAREW